MINILTLSSVALATLRLAVTPASAHGYVSEPPSRQALCRMGQVPDCGEVEYEPHSVEAPQSSFSCNGDGARFPELNDEALWQNHFFTVPPGIESLPFTWTLTAPHRTATWEYIVITQGNAVLTSINDFNATPPRHRDTPGPLEWVHWEADGSCALEYRRHDQRVLFLR